MEGIWVGGVGERGCEKWWLGGRASKVFNDSRNISRGKFS